MADRAGEALAGVVDAITREMETFSGVRDDMLVRSRSLIRDCAHSIRAMHRHELDGAERMLAAARQDARAMVEPLAGYPDLFHSGSTQDALKELVEAHLLYAFITGGPLLTPEELEVTGATYLKGLTEAATEMRRFALDLMRQDRVEEAATYLERMDEIYSLLVTVDFPDAITKGLRRQTDVLRGVLERTRGDLTTAVRQEKMQAALRRVEERLG
ncbi:MAG: haloacid dehalogenase [Caldilineaceae bacterium]|nr:haloacid dehalogenase [Caldilineaceae bacterium]MDE0181193.1 haloacid dehalogenase [Caldilineaceae bacterium]